MVDGATGQQPGEWEPGEPYMILSRDTYANNREIVDAQLDTSQNRGAASVRRGNGYFAEASTLGFLMLSDGTGAVADNEELVQVARDVIQALPLCLHVGWSDEDTGKIEAAVEERQDVRNNKGIR